VLVASGQGGEGEDDTEGLFDVNGDWFYSPVDVLLIVMYLNRKDAGTAVQGVVKGEGEAGRGEDDANQPRGDTAAALVNSPFFVIADDVGRLGPDGCRNAMEEAEGGRPSRPGDVDDDSRSRTAGGARMVIFDEFGRRMTPPDRTPASVFVREAPGLAPEDGLLDLLARER
jgi:hypothetical protein